MANPVRKRGLSMEPVADRPRYEAPELKVLGTLHGLTEPTIAQQYGPTDGYTFLGVSITNASP